MSGARARRGAHAVAALRAAGGAQRATLGALTALALLALAWSAAPARASWGPGAELISVDWPRLEQADSASSAVAVSADGRYVVFQTRATNFFADGDPDPAGRLRRGGIFRYDRATGALDLVADGDQVDEHDTASLLLRGAADPSVSDDGRYVAFDTAQRLVPQDTNDNVDVYVRDMSVPLATDRAASGAYTLVSARDGGDDPAHYAPRNPPLPSGEPGSAVFAGHAISGDGRYVAFRTTEQASDLPNRPGVDTPPGNVFVRDLRAHRTVLVSRALDGTTPAGGALRPVAISGDGSTVAWTAENAVVQTRLLTGEPTDPTVRRYLWKRWDDAGAVTRRITGSADPDDPACPPDGAVTNDPTASGPCYGPLADPEQGLGDIGSLAPALSRDGWTVAFVAGAAPRPAPASDPAMDVYLTSMRPGVSRKAGTTVVTKGTPAFNARANGDVQSVALSGDGMRLLLVTSRSQFLAPTPPLIGDERSSPGGNELYLVDLAKGELRRLLHATDGSDADGTVSPNAQLSADGRVAAFVATSTNLVAGDANGVADAFALQQVDDPPTGPPPGGAGQGPVDITVDGGGGAGSGLRVRASSRADGSLLLRVAVPQAGKLDAVATASETAGKAKARRGGRVRARQVAAARARAKQRGTVQVVLKLSGRDRRAVLHGTRLRVRVAVTLVPGDGSAKRSASVAGTFRVPARADRRRRAAARQVKGR
ncbi:MAG TPA: hypothetical protein VFF79_11085 [Conexibacter sp.]|jgi:Tol biopolymer transport system component|nr:hypothetical protein [Conexibacter sp.]